MRFGANSVGFNVEKLKQMKVKADIFGEQRSFSQGQRDAPLWVLVAPSGVCLGNLRLKQTQADFSEPEFGETSPSVYT